MNDDHRGMSFRGALGDEESSTDGCARPSGNVRNDKRELTRRELLAGFLAGGAAVALAACGGSAAPASPTGSSPAASTSAASPSAAAGAAKPAGSASAPASAVGSWDDILAAAKKEGKVTVSGPPDPDARAKLPAAFKDKFGIELEYL